MAFDLGLPVRLEDHPLQQLQTARMIAAVAVPTVADPNTIDEIRSDRRYAIYCNQTTDAAIQIALDKAKATGTPRVFWYHDDPRWNTEVAAKWKRPGLVALIQAYRHKGEADGEFQARIKAEYERVTTLGWSAIIVLGVHRRQTAVNPPVYDLSVRDICHGVILFSELKLRDVIVFAEFRGDVPAEIAPYLERLVSNVSMIAELPTLVWPTPPDPPHPPEPPMLMTPAQVEEFELNEAIKAAHDFGYDNTHHAADTGFTEARQRVHEAIGYFRDNTGNKQDPTPNEAQAIVKMFHDYGTGPDARKIIDTSTKYQVLLR